MAGELKSPEEAVTIRYYGMVDLTRKGYLRALAWVGGVVLAGLIAGVLLGVLPPVSTLWRPGPPRPGPLGWFLHRFWAIILFFGLAQVVETLFTLRVFRRKEAERRTS